MSSKHVVARRSFLLKSALVSKISATLFDEFSSSYQSYNSSYSTSGTSSENAEEKPFVYVDTEGNVKLLTDMVDDDGSEEGIFAVSMAEDGWMEYLALQE